MIRCSCYYMFINDRFAESIIIADPVFVRYYTNPNMKSNASLIDHRPKIFRCIIAFKVFKTVLITIFYSIMKMKSMFAFYERLF